MKRFSAACLLALSIVSCAPMGGGTPPPQAGHVDHLVLLWLKRPGNAEDKRKLHDAAEELKQIPGLISIRHGDALPSDRDVVDDSFDVAYITTFDSVDSLHAYDTHPVHAKLADELIRPLCRKIIVYDVKH